MGQELTRRPAGLTKAELDEHHARVFVGQCCVLGSSLVMPTMLLWRAFKAFGDRNGFVACSGALRRLLDDAPWAEVVEMPHARGHLKSIVKGVGMMDRASDADA
jgi:hypothetical protein